MKIAITGATGFLGSRLIQSLSERHEIQALSRRPVTEQYTNIKYKNIKWLIGDLSSEEVCLDLLKDVDILIHLAQSNSPFNSDSDLVIDANLNLLPTLRLLSTIEKSKRKIHIVYASSGGAIYGNNPQYTKFKETDQCFPNSSYGIQKQMLENYLRIISNKDLISTTVLRIANPYGVLLPTNRKQGLIGVVLNRILNNQKIQIIGNPDNIRDYVYIDDVINAFELAINYRKSNFEIFNIACGIGHSVKEIIKLIENELPEYKIQKEYINNNYSQDLANSSVLDITKANEVLQWYPKMCLEHGIKYMCESLFAVL